jgi:hypothetical protein
MMSTLTSLAKQIGDLAGLNFKYFFYHLDLEDRETELYVYPDENVLLTELDELEFDKLDYPTNNKDQWVKYRYF